MVNTKTYYICLSGFNLNQQLSPTQPFFSLYPYGDGGENRKSEKTWEEGCLIGLRAKQTNKQANKNKNKNNNTKKRAKQKPDTKQFLPFPVRRQGFRAIPGRAGLHHR